MAGSGSEPARINTPIPARTSSLSVYTPTSPDRTSGGTTHQDASIEKGEYVSRTKPAFPMTPIRVCSDSMRRTQAQSRKNLLLNSASRTRAWQFGVQRRTVSPEGLEDRGGDTSLDRGSLKAVAGSGDVFATVGRVRRCAVHMSNGLMQRREACDSTAAAAETESECGGPGPCHCGNARESREYAA